MAGIPNQDETPPRGAVMVVEDDPDMRAMLKDFLELEGYRVIDRVTGEQALSAIEAEAFTAVILDKEIPGMRGLDVLSVLRRRWPKLPVILITAFGGTAVAEEAFARGAKHYLEKPFRVDDLLAVLRSVCAEDDDPRPC
jgi:DNA-binding response OmpR family regulator